MSDSLLEAWSLLTNDFPDKKVLWWSKIVANHSDKERVYHNLTHLETKYSLFNTIKHLVRNESAVQLALFFNYLEYDPKSMENSEKNVNQFRHFSADCGIDPESALYKDVVELLKSAGTHITEEHKDKSIYGSDDKHYFLDLDMAVLGSNAEEYAEYAEKVKQEYHFLPTVLYNSLRVKVLQNFLQIPNIFATQMFREKLEHQARLNIQLEIESLQ